MQLKKKPYWLPNLFTSLTLMSGFYAIVLALEENMHGAVHAVLIAMMFDFMDGWIARKTNTVSSFGKEYDSLCDMVAFGLTPAITSYQCVSWDSHIAWIIPAVYSIAVARRLARFNSSSVSLTHFEGLPCTVSGPMVMLTCYWLQGQFFSLQAEFALLVIVLGLSFLMNSKIKYRSFKQNQRVLVRKKMIVCCALVLTVGSLFYLMETLGSVMFLYICSPLLYIRRKETQFHHEIVS